jgi:hypothetical protein
MEYPVWKVHVLRDAAPEQIKLCSGSELGGVLEQLRADLGDDAVFGLYLQADANHGWWVIDPWLATPFERAS